MESRYDIREVESRIAKRWEDSGYFNPDACVEKGVTAPDAEPFSIVLPPPNVTGTLHIGHAFEDAIQDTVVRFERMRGKRTLWVPGTDHAAIATQAKVEKNISKEEGKSRHDLGREEFLKRVNAFAKASHDTIVTQVKRMGASLDWSREAYTLDEPRNLAVRTAFKKMYDLGLIYRGDRVVNWDPKGQTVISDDEIVYEERKAKLYTFRYSKDFPIAVSTTRPETKVGDTAVAVHPDDPRYRNYVGQEYNVDFLGIPLLIKVVADPSVDRDFGTGALGVTPSHSMIDWELAQKHGLTLKTVIDERARMANVPAPLAGMKVAEAREWVVERLRSHGLLEKEEDITQNVSTAERTGGVIEPLPKLQWFVAVEKPFTALDGRTTTIKAIMRDAVASGRVKIIPERFEREYFNWIENLRDWCISRQLWFGHRIPAWYKNGALHVDIDAPAGEGWEQDSDTLDTWFSSGMWTFSTLGWPQKTRDLEIFHPTSLINPGYEILFFWVARMILMTGVLLGDIPFGTASIHGMVRDAKGQKFSKSLGNGVDPLALAEKYGADALRMGLIAGAAPGSDVKFDEQRVKGYRNFSTKIWNIARFILMNKPVSTDPRFDFDYFRDRVEMKEIVELKQDVTAHLEAFDLHLASEKLYHYIWHTLANKIVEAEKPRLREGSAGEKAESYALLEHLLLESLKMLHPFMPFITEEIFGIFRPEKMLMIERW